MFINIYSAYSDFNFFLFTESSSIGQQPYLVLETIVEETSDDLRSESDKSGPSGWNSDSDAESVIHNPTSSGSNLFTYYL